MTTMPSATPDEKLRYQLDLQARQIDAVLDHHQVSGTVTSGNVQRRTVQFDVQAPLSAGLERVRGLKDNLMAALGVRDVVVDKQGGRWRLQVERIYEPPVSLAALMASLTDLPEGTAVAGLAESGRPVLLSFGPNAIQHVLVAGDSGAGKTTLLRTIATSLAALNRQSDVQLMLIEGARDANGTSSRLWHPLAYLPHLMTDPVSDPGLAAEVLHFLVGEMNYRRKQRVRLPRIVVLLDDAIALLEAEGRQVTDDLLRLLQHGGVAGIHVVLATAQPESDLLDALFLSNLPVRLLGRLTEPAQIAKLAGETDPQAAYLRGSGEFIALAEEQLTYFQAADISDYDLHWEINRLVSNGRPSLLAQPYDTRPAVRVADPVETSGERAFRRDSQVQWAEASEPVATPQTSLPFMPADEAGDSAGGSS